MADYASLTDVPWFPNHHTKIKNIVIREGVTNIGNTAFSRCSNLASVELSNSVTKIGNYAFYLCNSLVSIEIPNNVIYSIGDYAFYYCEALASITLPNSITNIGEKAFYACNGLESITVQWAEPLIVPENVFGIVETQHITLYVPQGKGNAYRNAKVWKEFQIEEYEYVKIPSFSSRYESVTVYPNPTTGQLIIDNGELTIENVEIYDVVGRLLQSTIVNLQSEIVLDVSHLARGMYFLKIDGKTVKFSKE